MFITAKKRSGRNESLMVFNFTSIEGDFKPFIEEMERHTADLHNEHEQKLWSELIDKIQTRCDDYYAKGNVVASSSLFADEAALFMEMASLLLVVL